jgi:hypothetical protein
MSFGLGLYRHAGSWVETGVTGETERYAHELPAFARVREWGGPSASRGPPGRGCSPLSAVGGAMWEARPERAV